MFTNQHSQVGTSCRSFTPSNQLPALQKTIATYYNERHAKFVVPQGTVTNKQPHQEYVLPYTQPDNIFIAAHVRSLYLMLRIAVQSHNQGATQDVPKLEWNQHTPPCVNHYGYDTRSNVSESVPEHEPEHEPELVVPPSEHQDEDANTKTTANTTTLKLHVQHTVFPQPFVDDQQLLHCHTPQLITGHIRHTNGTADQTPLCAFVVFPANVTDRRWQSTLTRLRIICSEVLDEMGTCPPADTQRLAIVEFAPWMVAYDTKCRALVTLLRDEVVLPSMHNIVSNMNVHGQTIDTVPGGTEKKILVREMCPWEFPEHIVGIGCQRYIKQPQQQPQHQCYYAPIHIPITMPAHPLHCPHTISVVVECPDTNTFTKLLSASVHLQLHSRGTFVFPTRARPSSNKPSLHNLLFVFAACSGVVNGADAVQEMPYEESSVVLERWCANSEQTGPFVEYFGKQLLKEVEGMKKWFQQALHESETKGHNHPYMLFPEHENNTVDGLFDG